MWSEKLRDWKSGRIPTLSSGLDCAFIWKTSPISSKRDLVYKETVKKDSKLDQRGVIQDYTPFLKDPIDLLNSKNRNKEAITSTNLSGDTHLVIPMPRSGKNYANMYNFMISASGSQQKALWKLVAQTVEKLLKSYDYLWVSTHGHGVNYLHVRLSTRPKYYGDSKLRFIP